MDLDKEENDLLTMETNFSQLAQPDSEKETFEQMLKELDEKDKKQELKKEERLTEPKPSKERFTKKKTKGNRNLEPKAKEQKEQKNEATKPRTRAAKKVEMKKKGYGRKKEIKTSRKRSREEVTLTLTK